MVVDTKNWEVPTEKGYNFLTPYVRTVQYHNGTVLCAIDTYAHDKEQNKDLQPAKNQRIQDGQSQSYDLFDNFKMPEGTELQFGCDVVDGEKNNQDNHNVAIASARPWKDGLYYHAIVKVTGGVQNITVKTENPQVNDH